MPVIGIDRDRGLVYEGDGKHGRAVWPPPVITPARIVLTSVGPLRAEQPNDPVDSVCRFREDSYDPVSRIRRGRFYIAGNRQPVEWFVQPHPALPFEGSHAESHGLCKWLDSFHARSIWSEYAMDRREQPLVLLGRDQRFTIWAIIDIEVISTGEELVTLKSRSGLGILPEIDFDKVPISFRARVGESLDTFADEARRSAPASVIDRARDAASQILLAYFEAKGSEARDLARLAKRLEDDDKIVGASAAKIIARLHARAKPSERERRAMRTIREQDAQLAIQCLGTLLCEVGWADWS